MNGFGKLIVITLLLLIVAGCVFLIAEPEKTTEIVITPGSDAVEYKYGIFGAVKEPGYYSAEGPLRIDEAVETAGGMTDEADPVYAQLAKWITDGETVIIPTRGAEQPTLTPILERIELIDLNHASPEELMSLPGIGKKRAADIIELREQMGGFTAREDILAISGISEKLLESIYDQIIVK